MLELLFCSMLTIVPDFLFRRWGITDCLILTAALNQPSR